jgi:two-component system, OmpR family, sensor kinase
VLHSVRARLALWYAGTFALALGAFAVAAYAFLAHTSLARVDEYLLETAQTVADAVAFAGAARVPSPTVAGVLAEFRPREVTIVALDAGPGGGAGDGRMVFASRAPGPRRAPALLPADTLAALLRRAPRDAEDFTTVPTAAGPVRVATLPTGVGGRRVVFGAAQSLAARERQLNEAEAALALWLPVMLLVATAGGYWLARESLRPVSSMAERAERIGALTLHERLPVKNPRDELGRLATVFNGLLGRVEDAFDRQRRFAADASHELRTPVTVIGGEAEVALSRADRPAAELREALTVIRGEARRLGRVVDDLFLLARADAGDRQIAREELYLNDLVAESTRALRSVAGAKGVELSCTDAAAGDLPFRGDEALLRRMLGNLLDNALKYTPPGGRVTVRAARRDGDYLLAVADTGPGVPEEARTRLFTRFFRARRDSIGVGDPSGAGLGLAIARWVAEAHGGTLRLSETGPEGSTFEVVLPAGVGEPA